MNLFAALWVVGLCAFLGSAILDYLALWNAARLDQRHLQRAVRLQPGDAEYWNLLGRDYLFREMDAPAALVPLRRAVDLNPRVQQFWFDLATNYALLGDVQQQERALEQAVAANPRMPSVSWDAANFYLANGKTDQAWRHFRTVVTNDRDKREAAFSVCLRAGAGPDTIIDNVLPPGDPDAYLSLLSYFATRQQLDNANVVWARIRQLGMSWDVERSFSYIHLLLAYNEVDRAESVWRDLASVQPGFANYERGSNLLINGGFEQDILDAGFDWRFDPVPHVSVALDTSVVHGGLYSLSFEFDGNGTGNTGMYQILPVTPKARYLLTGFMKTESITGAVGPRFVIAEPGTSRVIATSEDSTGSVAWRQLGFEFTAPANAHQLSVTISNYPASGLMKGKLWVDDVEIHSE